MYMMNVSPTFFATMGIPVQRGRGFDDHDDATAPQGRDPQRGGGP